MARLRRKAASALLGGQIQDLSPEAAAATVLHQRAPTSLALLRREAARLERKYQEKAQRKDRQARESISKWLEKQPALSAMCKELADSKLSMQMQPGLPPGSILLEADPSQRGCYAMHLLASLKTKGTNLKAALEASFALMTRTISAADALPMQDDVAESQALASPMMPMPGSGPMPKAKTAPKAPKCYDIGYCIHDHEQGGDGHKANIAFVRIITAIKLQFPRVSHFRAAHLRASSVVMLLQGALATSADSQSDQESCSTHLWHIGILYLTPFRPTLRICNLAKPDQTLDGPVDVIATNMYSTLRATSKTFDFARTWHLRFFHLRESDRPLPYFDPSKVVMVPYEGAASHQVWPRPGRGKGKKEKKPIGKGGADVLAIEGEHDLDDGHEPGGPEVEEQLGREEDPEEVEQSRKFNALLEDARAVLEERAKAE